MENQLETKLKLLQFVLDNKDSFSSDYFTEAEKIYQWDISSPSPTQKDKLRKILDDMKESNKPKTTDKREMLKLVMTETKLGYKSDESTGILNPTTGPSFTLIQDLEDLENELNELEPNC